MATAKSTVGSNLFTRYTSTVDIALTDPYGYAALIRCTAGNLPTDAGYAIGCMAYATDSGAFYTNTGTVSVASFTLISASAVTLPTALTDATATTGNSASFTSGITSGTGLYITSTAITTGKLISVLNGNTTSFTTGAAAFYGDLDSATAGNGLKIVTSGAYTGTGLLFASAGAMTTGVGLQLTSTTGLTSGSLIRTTTSTAGILATNGANSFRGTGAFTSNAAGLVDISASAAVGAAIMLNITTTAASQTATNLITATQSGATITAYTASLVALTGGFSGNSSTGNVLSVTAVNTTAGDAVKIVNNAITVGAATLLNLSHTTSVLGNGTSMARITSTGADTGSTTGTLLDLAQSAAVSNVAVLLTDSSADTTARTGIKVNVTNAAAVGVIPLSIQSVAVTGSNSKFKKIAVFGGVTLWVGIDAGGNTANGQLTGVAGDICFNGGSNKPEYCTANGTTWTTIV